MDIDPLTAEVDKLKVCCVTRLLINGSSLKSFEYLVQKNIGFCAAYKNTQEEYLLILKCKDESYAVYKLSNGGKDIYVSDIVDGKVVPPSRDYSDMVELSGFDMGFTCKMYKLMNVPYGVSCYNILVGLLANAGYGDSVDISFLSNIKEDLKYNLVYLKEENRKDIILPISSLDAHLRKVEYEKVTRKEVEEWIRVSFDHPAMYFSQDEELEKAQEILTRYGYSEISSLLKEYNGEISNYCFSSGNESIAIFDLENSNSYYIRHLCIKPVCSCNGTPLYYELRSYALGDTIKYTVLASSINKNYLQKIIKCKLADTIRSSRVHYSTSEYYLNELIDEKERVSISCFIPSSMSLIYKGVYDKRRMIWSYEADVPKLARDFMSCLVKYFDKKYNILDCVKS